jgi:hypothetical protein
MLGYVGSLGLTNRLSHQMGDLWSDVLGEANSHGVTGGVYRA